MLIEVTQPSGICRSQSRRRDLRERAHSLEHCRAIQVRWRRSMSDEVAFDTKQLTAASTLESKNRQLSRLYWRCDRRRRVNDACGVVSFASENDETG